MVIPIDWAGGDILRAAFRDSMAILTVSMVAVIKYLDTVLLAS